MHVAIRRFQVDPGSVDEIMRHINEGFIPLIKDAKGFLAYYALKASDSEIATVSVFEDQAGAEASNKVAGDYARQNLASLTPNPPQITAGVVYAHELNLTKLGVREVKQYASSRNKVWGVSGNSPSSLPPSFRQDPLAAIRE